MYIRQIRIQKFRHIEEATIGPFVEPPTHSDLIALAGPNGGGKSSILELVGFALSNTWSLAWSALRSMPDNSFEVEIAITKEEQTLVRNWLEGQTSQYNEAALAYIRDNGTYYRGFNYADGNYQAQASLFNQVHNIVTKCLRDHYQRPLGFFMQPDRSYGAQSFKRERIFEYDKISTTAYKWSLAFQTAQVQYRDLFEFLVQHRYHYIHKCGIYYHNQKSGSGDAVDPPTDPLTPYNDLLKRLFPGYEFVDTHEDFPTDLYVSLPTSEQIAFHDLSSGEKEVFFILSFFLRQNVSNAIILIDEPELHLHPELARLLIRTMQSVQPGNQIWLATHSPEIVDEAGNDRVIYIDRDKSSRKAIVTVASDEPQSMHQLRNLFGFSGYIGIGRKMVFLEGEDASSDRKIFSRLFPEYGGDIRFVSSKSVGTLMRVNWAVLSILEENLGWMEYYLIRDRDYLDDDLVSLYKERYSGRLYVLDRFHIENYLLDADLIANTLGEIFSRSTTENEVEEALRRIARDLSAEFLRDMLAYRLSVSYRIEDFSIGDMFKSQSIFDDAGATDKRKADSLRERFNDQISTVNAALADRTNKAQLDDLMERCLAAVHNALADGSDAWKKIFPGRRILEEYVRRERLAKLAVFQNSLIKEMASRSKYVPPELRSVISTISKGGKFQ